ncbi:hypothetical protein [Nocardioides nanhaiensis]|uniref:DUF3566 domain-containing protein n=1 Tax=Nocardioides nanhaiensis TaxID=1476871 RepID=A0ABP8W6R8_9ACTN
MSYPEPTSEPSRLGSSPRRFGGARFSTTGPVRAARQLLASTDRAATSEAVDPGAARSVVGRLLVADALHGLRHPDDPRLLRVGFLGSVLTLVVTGLFTLVAAVMFTSVTETFLDDLVPSLFGDDPMGGVGGKDGDAFFTLFSVVTGAFVVIGSVMLLGAVVRIAAKAYAVVSGLRLARTPASTGQGVTPELEDQLHRELAAALAFSTPQSRQHRRMVGGSMMGSSGTSY